MPTPTPLAVDRLVQYFETLSHQGVTQIPKLYSPYARFVDPFNDVAGLPAIEGIFTHMFVALEAPRFVVTERIVQGPQCFLTWDFSFGLRKSPSALLTLGPVRPNPTRPVTVGRSPASSDRQARLVLPAGHGLQQTMHDSLHARAPP